MTQLAIIHNVTSRNGTFSRINKTGFVYKQFFFFSSTSLLTNRPITFQIISPDARLWLRRKCTYLLTFHVRTCARRPGARAGRCFRAGPVFLVAVQSRWGPNQRSSPSVSFFLARNLARRSTSPTPTQSCSSRCSGSSATNQRNSYN